MKGLILSTDKRFAYVIDDEGGFRRVYLKKGYRVGDAISITAANDASMREPRKRVRLVAAIAACFVLLSSGVVFGSSWDKEAYSLYIDTNPSVKLEINTFDQVISRQSLNADGAELFEQVTTNGSVVGALGSIVAGAQMEDKIGKYGVSITMAGGDNVKLLQLERLCKEHIPGAIFSFSYVTQEEAESAMAQGATPHKYELAQKAHALYPELSVERAIKSKAEYLEGIIDGSIVFTPETK